MAATVSHDQNFKNLFVEYPREALEFCAPGEAPQPDDEATFLPVRQEQLKARLGDRFRELDVPLQVTWADGRRAAVVFALEEESDPSRFSPHRLAHYCLDLAAMLKTDRVVPVVIFLRNAGRVPASLALGTERRAYLTFEYVACRLAEIPGEDWMDSRNLVARVNLPNMGGYQARRMEFYAAATHGLFELESDPARREKYLDFIDTYADLTDNERRRYRELYPQEGKTMAGMFQRAREESMQQGLNRGRAEGRTEGERTLLQRQLRRRFGACRPKRPRAWTGRRRPISSPGPRTCSTRAPSTRCSPRTAAPETDESGRVAIRYRGTAMKNRMVVWRIICRTGGEDGFELRRRLWLRRILQQARDEGGREMLRDLLLLLLRERFGPLPPETDERVDRASAPDLESWTENLMVAGTLDEVFAPNRQCLAAGWHGVGNSKRLASTA